MRFLVCWLIALLVFVAQPALATVSTTDNTQFYDGNGSTTSFAFTFKTQNATDIKTKIDGVIQLTSAYTVTLNSGGLGGTVLFNTAPATGKEVLIYREVPLTQTTAVPTVDKLSRGALENMDDKAMMAIQQLDERMDRAILQQQTSDALANLEIPSPSANKYLGWNNAATALENKTLTSSSLNNTAMAGKSKDIAYVNATEDGFTYYDTPTMSGSTNRFVTVNATEDGFSFTRTPDHTDGYTIDGLKIKDTDLPEYVPENYYQGCRVVYTSANVVTIKKPCIVSTTDSTVKMEIATDLAVNIGGTDAALGLVDGTDANSTWYYIYIIQKSSDLTVSAVASTVNEAASGSIDLAWGGAAYDRKRQLRFAVRNDGSAAFIPFFHEPNSNYIGYNVDFPAIVLADGQTQIKNAGTDSSFTDVSGASYIPPISIIAKIKAGIHDLGANGNATFNMRTNGSSLTYGMSFYIEDSAGVDDFVFDIETDSSQVMEYKVTASDQCDITVMGYYVTGVK